MFACKHPFSTRGKVRFKTGCVSHHQREGTTGNAKRRELRHEHDCQRRHRGAGIVLALLKAGKAVLRPVSNGLRYDIVVDNLDATFTRVQCKTGQLVEATRCGLPAIEPRFWNGA
jgi:hypothetical protein